HLAGVDHAGSGFAAPLASSPAYLEQVREIIAEADREVDDERSIAVILHSEPLIGGRLPEKCGADDVKRVLFKDDPLVLVDIRIGQIDAEDGIVVADTRAQQQGCRSLHAQLEIREKSGIAMEQPVRAPSTGANVAVAVEHDEGVAVLENPARPRSQCGR